MTDLYLVRRWGSNPAGTSVSVEDDEQVRWLLGHNFAQRSKDSTSVTDGAAAPGMDGPAPRAGGDATRRRPTSMRSSDTRDNKAWPVAGSPVQFNAGVAPVVGGSASGGAAGVDQDSNDLDRTDGDDQLPDDQDRGPSSKITSRRRKSS